MLAELISRYGYVIVVAGTFFEGETIVVIAGYAAHRGHLSLPGVMVSAFIGSLLGDQLAYLLGRRYAARVLRHREAWRPKIEHVRQLLERRAVLVMLGFRFLYGVRTVTPFTIGSTGVSPRVFAPLNATGAAIWAVAVSALGYAFGQTLTLVFERAHRYEEWVIASIALMGGLVWFVRRRRAARAARSPDRNPSSS